MRKNIFNVFNNIIYGIFVIMTIFVIIIVYKNIESTFAIKFIMGYFIFVCLFLFYIILATILHVRKFKCSEIGERVIRFVTIFVVFGASICIFNYIFIGKEIDFIKTFSISFGSALGISFLDLIFFNKKEIK